MTTTVYAVKEWESWQWRATLHLQADAAYWRRKRGEDVPLLWTGASLSWGQAVRLRDRLIRNGWMPPDERSQADAQADEKTMDQHWREFTSLAAEAGVPETVISMMRLQNLPGIGKQPSLEQMDHPDVQQLAAAVRGRSLFRDELLSLCAAQGIDAAGDRWLALVQAAELEGLLEIRCGVEEEEPPSARQFFPDGLIRRQKAQSRRLVCRRCGAGEELLRFASCPRCGGLCAYCERCLGMGRSRMCEPLIEAPLQAWPGHLPTPTPSSAAALIEKWGLSPAQAEASSAALRFLEGPAGGGPGMNEFLIWAVTGAGKTEMIFPLLAHERAAGRRVLVATPRKDVVLELLPRLRSAFPQEKVVALYGGSEERWETAGITLATTHQLLRFSGAFDLVVLDEIDAFPYAGDPMLTYAAERAMAAGGRRILLSATPPRELAKLAEKGRLPHAKVPARYHGQPLPVPRLVRVSPLAKWASRGSAGGVPRPLKRLLDRSLLRGAQLFVFVPEIRLVEPLAALLQRCYPERTVSGTSSKDAERVEKVAAFRQRQYDILVTTTILERGVTVPRTDVFVLDAHASWFDEAALIQMAGRAGRSKEDPAGYVVYAGEAITRNQTGAVRQIRRMNRIARKKGYLALGKGDTLMSKSEIRVRTSVNVRTTIVPRLRSALQRFIDGLWAPPREECLTCQGPLKGPRNPLGICDSCFATIPWITHARCPVCGRPEDCPDCRRGYPRNFLLSRSAVRYDPLMKEWLARFKYRGDERYARLLGTMLHQAYALLGDSLPPEAQRFDCLTFVPVSRERLYERGFNQAERTADELARHLGLPVYSLLLRTHSTVKQSMKTRTERFLDLRHAFAPDEEGISRLETAKAAAGLPAAPAPLRILLVDDVYTTGSTMQECSAVLRRRLGADICGLTWAR